MRRSWSAIALVAAWRMFAAEPLPQTVEFNRDIRPILSDKCFTCHGPDRANRKTKLRFDSESGAKQDLGGHFAIVPGQPDHSEMVRRISSPNKAFRMPPAYTGTTLSPRDIALIRRWIEQGAKWEKHWSFLPPKRPEVPAVENRAWVRNPIDAFILARLEKEGLKPSPEADRATLLRRVTLDLTGLPPTPAELDAFLHDTSPDAYEKVVDRLLASPRYGERMAERWLDAARYADTNGYQTDGERSMWRWRDWVIDAFNRNMRFDEFTVEQIAGDMLPNATLDQRIASGFNRNHRGNGEGGIIPEEYAVEYVVDRVDTTATVWLGITLGCARCHDHKYDPFSQKEFYQVFAYFNNVPERGKAWKYGNSPPFIQAPTREQQAELQGLERKLADAEQRFSALQPELVKAQRKWEKSARKSKTLDWSIQTDLAAEVPLGRNEVFDGKRAVDGGNKADFGFYDKFTLAAWVYATAPTGAIVTRAQDVAEGEGYGLYLKNGKLQVNLVKRWLDDALRVESEGSLELNQWHHVAMTYDGSRLADGVRIYIDGVPQKIKPVLDDLNQSFQVKEPLRVGGGGGPENRFRGRISDARVYHAALPESDIGVLATAASVGELARIAPEQRTKPQADKVSLCFLDQYAPQRMQAAWRELTRLRRERERMIESFPTVMVMQEREKPRDTFLLIRGAYDRPGQKVSPAVPAVLPPLPAGVPDNRLGFAKWLVDSGNPLTARVTVNRFWQMFFGTGIVKTVEDFGSQGEWPTHPELLDWLATEFMRDGWDMKAIIRTMVTSAAYRQSSTATPELLQKDPENRLLARGPRFRLPAEMVRDQALAVAGLLVERVGGPSVKPYQPAGLWKELGGGDYKQDHGESLYRRSMYTFWKRTAPPPSMVTFDAAGREMCTVRETRTNTPLQALDLMNDVTYVEAARKLAERMMTEGGTSASDRIAWAFRLATAHAPAPEQRRILLESYSHYRDNYQTHPGAAAELLSEGESPRDQKLDTSDLAAYTAVASLILNLDETVTKE
ncbi:MAG TPA: DUF1553 domain-containing protein [Bryobacteraceae bacterium]|nr:DUF1553 domain-containing protein [Bryobacteraceae bacterium]